MTDYRLLWGDIHNHNELGYAQGSLARSYEIARSHLDFYAFTPHGIHADGGVLEGYPVVREGWDEIAAAARVHNEPDVFTTFLAYEWHSNQWGHVHIVHREDVGEMVSAPTLEALQAHYRGQAVMLVPHHTAYHQGVDWGRFDKALSPLVEIFSEHGCSERDVGPYPMLVHSGGPGAHTFTAQHGLALGKRFGFTAGTDNHDGYPGGYGLGLTGVWATANTREALWEAFQARRTTAVTGDRIDIEFSAGEAPMGSVVEGAEELTFRVEGWDVIDQVEVVRDGIPVWRTGPDWGAAQGGDGRYRLRFEWGWGPMKGYQVYDWEGTLRVEGGRLRRVVPNFSSDPFDEHRRKQILAQDESVCRWQSHTSRGAVFTTRNGTLSARSNDALCLEVEGDEDTRIELEIGCQTHTSLLATSTDWSISPRLGRLRRTFTVGELLAGRQGMPLEEMPTWVVAHRAVPEGLFRVEGAYPEEMSPGCYYLRVRQENGQMGWASPIWVE